MKLMLRITELFFLIFALLLMCATFIIEKVCHGNFVVDSSNIDSFKNCTRIDGALYIKNEAFNGNGENRKMEPSELEVFSTLREVSGLNIIMASHPNFTDLHYFRNLKKIHGRNSLEGLQIIATSLKFLGLRALTALYFAVIIENNTDLCFADDMNWWKFSNFGLHRILENNRPKSECVAEEMVCHKVCSLEGCWGPSIDDCLSCVINSPDNNTCLDSCSYPGLYQLGIQKCGKCDEVCNETCTYHEPWNCKKCFKDGPYCVASCPEKKYQMNGECVPCNEKCAFNCTGPGGFVGPGGCDTCDKAIADSEYPNKISSCININEPCVEGYFTDLISLNETAKELKSMAGKFICRRCHPKCKKCKGYGFDLSVCDYCLNFRTDEQCEDQCPEEYYTNYTTNSCLNCSRECKGCYGPGPEQCLSCRNKLVHVGGTTSNNFYCSSNCPEDMPHVVYEGEDVRYCYPLNTTNGSQQEKVINVPAIVGGVLGCMFVISIIVAVVAYQCWQRAKLRENTAKMTMIMSGLEDVEPLKQSDLKPNLTQLRIVKEAELRKGGILGNGAFGTVYKALWIPENENVKIPVAVKLLQEGTGTNKNKEILEEAYIMASVTHPHLLKLLAVCLASPMMLVTQLMPLGCLLDYVRNNKDRIGSKALLNWCMQIAKGMAHLEEKHLVHRDLAARNVLVQTPGFVKITDFGLAKLLDIDETAYQATGGKVAIKWLAPECIHHRCYTHRSDVWAFGWMLDSESRPSFQELAEDFAKMARDPGRYLVIEGDSLMRLPTYTPKDEQELIRKMSVTNEGTEGIMYAEDYLRLTSPDDNETPGKSTHSYLEVVGDPACTSGGKNGKNVPDFSSVKLEDPVDGEDYLIAKPPEYDYAYDDLGGSIHQVEDTELLQEDLKPVIMTDNSEYVMMSIDDAEQTVRKPQQDPSSKDSLDHECINDSAPCVDLLNHQTEGSD